MPKKETIVSYPQWLNIDAEEVERGQKDNKLREKILERDEMLDIVNNAPPSQK